MNSSKSILTKIYKRSLTLILLILSLFTVAGCKELEYLRAEKVTYQVQDYQADKRSKEDMDILVKRLNAVLPSKLSSVQFKEVEGKGVVEFSRGAPDAELVAFLSRHPGELVFRGTEPDDIWYSDKDIVESASVLAGDRLSVEVVFSDESYGKASPRIKQSIGRYAYTMLDDEILHKAMVQTELGKKILMTSASDMEAQALAVMLASGRMSSGYELVKL
ncbi:hypothetical protein O5O45_12495 [Hahella aquimaris]|uniref:hypothetical protein n=1 Tax=Hahella sp. HNIBRBA332 TaxID=3015983 RepID=UPI00273BE943|nr:hypothetical protein [Hahella sp. HNIBRBA332]WLQ16737.1 hypothetical protein O5O45_12495 [Hahella sp. HNIBRBA332]